MTKEIEKKVAEANRKIYTEIAETYDSGQPHFMAENIARVDMILSDLARKTGGNSLLDLGCGTGFIINIAKRYFKRVVGVDITPAMLNQIETADSNIELHEADTSNLSFLTSDSIDVCTSYSYLHHLANFKPTVTEALRCLRTGGIFYSDQDPNQYYWKLIDSIKDCPDHPQNIQREIQFVVHSLEESVKGTGLSLDDYELAEYYDISKGGMDADAIVAMFKEIGFSAANYRYEWYLGQSKAIHEQPNGEAEVIETYLRGSLPATRFLFKYFSIIAVK